MMTIIDLDRYLDRFLDRLNPALSLKKRSSRLFPSFVVTEW
jgi:hypothetical protein